MNGEPESPLGIKAHEVRWHRLCSLPPDEREKIIGRAFEGLHPDNDAKRQAIRQYERDHGNPLIGILFRAGSRIS